MWLLLLQREGQSITDESVAAIANKCRKLRSLNLW